MVTSVTADAGGILARCNGGVCCITYDATIEFIFHCGGHRTCNRTSRNGCIISAANDATMSFCIGSYCCNRTADVAIFNITLRATRTRSISYNTANTLITSDVAINQFHVLNGCRTNVSKQTLIIRIRLVNGQACDGQVGTIIDTFEVLAAGINTYRCMLSCHLDVCRLLEAFARGIMSAIDVGSQTFKICLVSNLIVGAVVICGSSENIAVEILAVDNLEADGA